VDGILLKGDDEDSMSRSIQSVINNEKYYSKKIQLEIEKQKAFEGNYSLTETEYYILKEICQGKSSEQISLERSISKNTVNTHKKKIFKKFNVHNAVELATLVANNDIK
jgi:DNA-binding NarL/FixJ family response regulator